MDAVRILVVDDEMVSREKLRLILGRHGVCECIETGEEAIKAFIRAWNGWGPYDLITLDIGLPDKSGLEVLKELRNLEDQRKVSGRHRARVIMVTSSSDREVVQQSVLAGCNDYIVKPVNAAVLGQKVEAMHLK